MEASVDAVHFLKFPLPVQAELSKLRKTVGARGFPSFAKEGWLRHKENGPVPYSAQTGWLFQPPIVKTVRDESAVA